MMRKFLVALGLLALSACAPIPPPNPGPPPPPPIGYHAVRATVRDAVTGDGLPQAIVTATPDNMEPQDCPVDPNNARFQCVFPNDVQHGDLLVAAKDYIPYAAHADLVTDLPDIGLQPIPPPPPPPPPTPVLPRVVVRNARFLGLAIGHEAELSLSDHFTAIGATDFNLLGRVANGEDIEGVLVQRASLGFNLLRVFTAFDIGVGSAQPIGRLYPSEHPDLYTVLIPRLADAAARHGLYLELVAYTGPYPFFGSQSDFLNHWAGLCSAAQGKTNILLERVNEYNNAPNLGAPDVPRCLGVVASNGSAILDSNPYVPVWDYATFHPGTAADGYWQRKVGHDAMDVSTNLLVPVTANETKRFPDQDDNCQHAYDAAASATLLAAGATYHSIEGKSSSLFSGTQLTCATAWAQGALSIPLDCQDAGGYVHRSDLENDSVIRAYQRGSDPRCVVLIHK